MGASNIGMCLNPHPHPDHLLIYFFHHVVVGSLFQQVLNTWWEWDRPWGIRWPRCLRLFQAPDSLWPPIRAQFGPNSRRLRGDDDNDHQLA